MAQSSQSEEVGGGQTGPGTGGPQGLFGSSTTILLIVFAVAVFWWSRRRRVETEERLRAQRREAEATAERSALDVAHLMRTTRPGAGPAAAREDPASTAERLPDSPAEPSAAHTFRGETDLAAAARTSADAPSMSDEDEGLAREIEHAEARAAADLAAEEQAARASQGAQSAGESLLRRMDAASSAAEEAAADNADAAQLGLDPGRSGASGAERLAAADPELATRETRPDAEGPAGAVAGDGTAICPPDYPIKGNRQSRIYHRPGQVSYPSTVAEYCFASEAAAESAGYRPSRARGQRSQPD